jgi:hypothetical protein
VYSNIFYINHNKIDKQKWDACIALSENRIVYALSIYLDILYPNWDAIIENDYQSVMPIIKNKKNFINYIYNPVFSARLGIFSTKPIDENLIHSFFNRIPDKFKLIHLKFNLFNTFPVKHFQMIEHITYELDVSKSYDDIFKNYSKNHKKNIKKANQCNITILKNNDISSLVSLKKNLLLDKLKSNIKETHFERLHKVLYFFFKSGNCLVYNAYNAQNTLCASAVFLVFFDRAIIFSATNNIGKENRAGYVLIDEFIKDNAGKKMILDFAGSDIKGIADFNNGFGSSKRIYPEYYANKLKFPFSLLKK